MTFYLKYRPQTINDLDLESVRDSLKNIIKSGNIPHAFLFSGPKGTGKTSAARILAKVINCENLGKDGEPCNKCSACLSITKGNNIDIIELDAASNRGIDDIRNLKEGIFLAPASAKKKIYIIDEAHMLTLEAANAFLKTLEEPPDHVVFILATTNPEKLPATVVSRLTRVNFRKADEKDISRQLKRVTEGEKIKITEAAIAKIANAADGSFRDAVKILEALSFKTKDINESDIEDLLPTFQNNTSEFFKILIQKNPKEVLEFIEKLVEVGVPLKSFIDTLTQNIHTSLLAKNGIGEDNLKDYKKEDLIKLNDLIAKIKNELSPVTQLPFEIAMVEFCNGNTKKENPIKEKEEPQEESKKEAKEDKAEEVKVAQEPKQKSETIKVEGEIGETDWQKLLVNIREKNVSIEALLRAARPMGYDGKTLKLGVYYKFHKERLEDTKNLKILEDICQATFEKEPIKVIFDLIEKPIEERHEEKIEKNNIQPLTTNADKDIIDAAKEIFG